MKQITIYPSEHEEQRNFVQWCLRSDIPIFAIPNGGKRSVQAASKLKLEGVSPGVPDLFIPVPVGMYHGLFVEMKREKNGVVTPEQKIWHKILETFGYKVVIGAGAESAQAHTKNYLAKHLHGFLRS